ncbi:MAG: adenylosuccinate lyase, partial [Ruminococcus sp.]|nr:adenylosuccinate lyase [Ruminococcus sp.]
LDDSANKRLSVPEAFLAIDGILNLYANVADGLVVYPKVIESRLRKELPFMATENIMMDAVKNRGADRQVLHEKIRQYSMEASRVIKEQGGENDLLELIAADDAFGVSLDELEKILQPEKYTGRAKEQTADFLNEEVKPILDKYSAIEDEKPEINV